MKKSKGITLIALVITIIILLILAGITMQMTFGENGLLNKVETAKTEQAKAELLETVKETYLGIRLNDLKNSLGLPIVEKVLGETNFKNKYEIQGDNITDKQGNIIERKENIVMHDKIGKKIVEVAVPILSDIVREGIAQGIFACTNVEERVKMLLIMSQNMFDYGAYSNKDIEVYVDMLEKSLGAKEGTMSFISEFLLEGQVHSPA